MKSNDKNFGETNPFGDEVRDYWDAGLRIIPTEPGTKEPARGLTGWPGYVAGVPKKEKQQQWVEQYRGYGIGLLTGSPLDDDHVLVGIDVDDDRMVRCAFAIFPDAKCAKIGKKGVTIFVRAPKADKIASTAFHNEQAGCHIDILAGNKYTVMPGSIHPDTGEPYRWHGEKITKIDLSKLPLFGRVELNLLKTIYGSKNLAPLLDGKTTHDAGVSMVAQIVRFADDDEVEAIIRAILPEGYDGDSLKELPGWIATAREKNFDKISEVPIDDAVALVIQENMKPLVYSVGDNFLRFTEGYWKAVSDVEIDRLAKQLLAPQIGPKRQVGPMLPSVRKCLSLNVEKPNFGQYSTKICLKNGTLDIPSGRLEEHSPDHQLRYQLDIEYDPAATCPVYEDQISQTLKGDAQAIALFDEFAALTLVPDMRFQKALYLVGPGGSGKSTLLKTVEMMHDPNAISVTPLDKIDSERYLTDLARKLVCISFDIQTTRKVFGESFIRITGGDPVTTRLLYKEVEGLVIPTVRFLGSMNPDMPRFTAAPDALERRLILLQCSGRVKQPDPDRFSALRAERAGILSRWVILNDDDLAARLAEKPKPVRGMRTNAGPIVLSYDDAPHEIREALPDIDILRRRAGRIRSDSTFSRRLIVAFLLTREQKQPSAHVEEQIYDEFNSDDDNAVMDRFHELDWSHRTPLVGQLASQRLRSLGQRLIYIEAPHTMSEPARGDFGIAIARRLTTDHETVPWLTYSKAIAEIDKLLSGADVAQTVLLAGHRSFLRERAEWATLQLK